MSYTVYKHTSPSGKTYIGVTGLNPVKRWGGQGQGYYGQQFYKAIMKYGWNNIRHEILFSGLKREDALKKEQELIAEYRSTDSRYGYNISSGGYATRLGVPCSAEARKKISEKTMGRTPWNKGKHCSDDTKQKIREKAMGRTPWNKGVARTDAEKAKMSKALKGKMSWNKGRHLSEEERQKLRQAVKGKQKTKPVLCIETGERYSSACEASQKTGFDRSSIAKCCRGVHKRVGGCHWSFA